MEGDILKADVEALVNTVNTKGIMGRGIALQFKKAFPDNFRAYEAACKKGDVELGRMFVFKLSNQQGHWSGPRFIINFPTKGHWKANSRIEDIEAGLDSLVQVIKQHEIRSIAIPPLGCGLGGLDWGVVRPMIERALEAVPHVRALLYEPKGAPAADVMATGGKKPAMTVGRATVLGLMRRYLAGLMDPFVSLLEIHKLMYLLQESGEQLKLKYEKGHYGPYTRTLSFVLTSMEGHYVQGYGDAEDSPEKQIEALPGAFDEAENFLEQHTATRERFNRVANLIEGFETPFGMELLTTVHWLAKHDGVTDFDETVRRTYTWNQHKRKFTERQIRVAWDVLHDKGWLNGNLPTQHSTAEAI